MHNGDNKVKVFPFILQGQRMQPSFMSETIRSSIHTIHNGNNEKLTKTYYYKDIILQRQHIKPNLMADVIRTFNHSINKRGKAKLRIFSFIPQDHGHALSV